MDKIGGNLDFLWYQGCQEMAFRIHGCDNQRHFVIEVVCIVFNIMEKEKFWGEFCMFSNNNYSNNHFEVKSFYFSIAKFFIYSGTFCTLFN